MALGLAEVLLLMVAVYLTISQFTRSRASAYIERFNSADALASRVAVDRWLRKHVTARERLMALDQDPELHTHVRRFANLFQELGAAYQFGVAHRRTVRVLFDALVVMYWEQLQFWIHDYRAQTEPTLYSRFEYLYAEIISRHRDQPVKYHYVIAYGSLMDPKSVSAALGRSVTAAELVPVSLRGWQRSWSIVDRVTVDGAPRSVLAVFLDLRPASGAEESAAMLRITPSELQRLATREKNYEARDLRSDVRLVGDRPVGSGARVWCFIGRDEHRVTADTEEAVILRPYLEGVARSSGLIDPSIDPALRSSAAATGYPIVDGSYEFIDAAQAALVQAWPGAV